MSNSVQTTPKSTEIFVFGSNLAGRHGKGAALFAKQNHGAIYGRGIGRQGSSYAIPTKGYDLEVLSLVTINLFVKMFKFYASDHPELIFNVTPIGCGLAGYEQWQIRPMFFKASDNVHFTKEWI